MAQMRTGELSGGMRQRLGVALLLLATHPFFCSTSPALALIPAGENDCRETALRGGAREDDFGHDASDRGMERRRRSLPVLPRRNIERELDPKSLPYDFSETNSATKEPEVMPIRKELIPGEQQLSIIC